MNEVKEDVILNNNNKLQPIGLVGEICIGGDGVGLRLLFKPRKNKLCFC